MSAYAKNYGYFFNSSSGDRTYNAESFEDWLKPFFLSGVFNGELQVKAQTTPDMTVKVTAGHANLDGKAATWETENTMTLAVASGVYDRIDTIVLRRDNINRTISIEVVTGTASISPQPTAPVRDADTFELVLAEVYVGTGVTSITQANITDKRMDSDVCGYVAATVEQIDFDQIQAQYDAWQEETQEFFTDWFEAIRGQLDEDAAGHLQNEVDDINTNIFGIFHLIIGNTAFAELNPGMFVQLKDSTIAGKADGYYGVQNHIANGATVVGSDLIELDMYGALNTIDQTHVNKKTDLVDNLTSTATDKALSAKQGKVLGDSITNMTSTSSLITRTNATSTTTEVNTYGGRKFSDYMYLHFFLYNSSTDYNRIRNSITIPAVSWTSGRQLQLMANHGTNMSSISGVTFTYQSDTSIKVITDGAGLLTGFEIVGERK